MPIRSFPIRIAVDIGGTFTDLQILDERDGRIVSHKVPTTTEDPSRGLMEGIRGAASRYGFTLDDVGYMLHGTTIATNAVLERRLPGGALVTTLGFEDVLEIGRHNRRDVYAVWPQPQPVLIPRDRRLGLKERMTARGKAEIPISPDDVAEVITALGRMEIEAVAICLLHAYANPAHERYLAEAIAGSLPHLTVSCSSEVSPEIREYERTSTTVLNALLQPVVRGYLDQLGRRMEAAQFKPRLLIVQSNGGVCSPETAAREPVRLLLSGPSGGAKAALALATHTGDRFAVGVDMGGTSFDVSVVRDGRIEIVTQSEIDRLPVRVPMIEIRTIGAGGGSIARVVHGHVTVGPESAGAWPGPVCYGRGGTEPTVTDANLVLGRLDPGFFLGGKMALDVGAARRAMEGAMATPLGLDVDAAAAGVLRITDSRLAAAIRVSLFEKGLDPRDFTMLSFGGAGSVHACAVAEELSIKRIVFPIDASTFSARGILDADIEHGFAHSAVRLFDEAALPAIAAMAAEMRTAAHARLESDGIAMPDRGLRFAIDLRYKGQAFELTVPWHPAAYDEAARSEVLELFHQQHEQRFSYANRDDIVEMVTLRLVAIGRLSRPSDQAKEPLVGAALPASRRVFAANRWADVPVWRREAIGATETILGPAIVEEDYTTLYLAPQWRLRRIALGHLVANFEGVEA